MSKLVAGAAAAMLLGATTIVPAVAASAPVSTASAARATAGALAPTKAKVFKNCTALNKKYPHGVGKSRSVKDRNSKGTSVANPVRTFTVSKSLYLANKSKDRDGDGIACEKL